MPTWTWLLLLVLLAVLSLYQLRFTSRRKANLETFIYHLLVDEGLYRQNRESLLRQLKDRPLTPELRTKMHMAFQTIADELARNEEQGEVSRSVH